MNWDAIGALGEIVGATAVVSTLIILIFQIRQGTKATLESNQLERAIAIRDLWVSIIPWIKVSSPKFVMKVQSKLDLLDKETDTIYKSVPLLQQRTGES